MNMLLLAVGRAGAAWRLGDPWLLPAAVVVWSSAMGGPTQRQELRPRRENQVNTRLYFSK